MASSGSHRSARPPAHGNHCTAAVLIRALKQREEAMQHGAAAAAAAAVIIKAAALMKFVAPARRSRLYDCVALGAVRCTARRTAKCL